MQFGASESVAHWGKYRPNSIAVHSNGTNVTYQQLNAAVDKLTDTVLQQAPHPSANQGSDRIAVAVSSRLQLLVSILAILRAARSAVILHSDLPAEELQMNL